MNILSSLVTYGPERNQERKKQWKKEVKVKEEYICCVKGHEDLIWWNNIAFKSEYRYQDLRMFKVHEKLYKMYMYIRSPPKLSWRYWRRNDFDRVIARAWALSRYPLSRERDCNAPPEAIIRPLTTFRGPFLAKFISYRERRLLTPEPYSEPSKCAIMSGSRFEVVGQVVMNCFAPRGQIGERTILTLSASYISLRASRFS